MGDSDDIDLSDIDYFDPDEEPAGDSLEGADEAAPVDDDPPEEGEGAEDEQDNDDADGADDPVFDIDGEEVPLSQLKAWKEGHLRQDDYSRKTAELARERETVQQARQVYTQNAQFAQSLLQETLEFLQGAIPDEPPLSLAQQSPEQYHYQKELRQRVQSEIQQLVQKSQQAGQKLQQVSGFDKTQAFTRHVEGLRGRFPHLKGDDQKLVKFVQDTRQKAVDEWGFAPQEVAQVTDDRLLSLIHYAEMGKKAEHNRNNAKRRLAKPQKGAGRAAQSGSGDSNRKAMQRLSKTGSLKDALMIDFE